MAVDGSFWEGLAALSPRPMRPTTNSLDGFRACRVCSLGMAVRLESLTYFGASSAEPLSSRPIEVSLGNNAPSDFAESARCNGKSHRQRGNDRRSLPTFPIYNIPASANFINAPTPVSQSTSIRIFCQERTYGFLQNFILLILASTIIRPVLQDSRDENRG